MNKTIPIFFSCDDKYVPFLAVDIRSLVDNANKSYNYDIQILNTGLDEKNYKKIESLKNSNTNISFVNVTDKMKRLGKMLHLRDYYTASIYFRIFIPNLFPQYEKAIYLDSDTTILGDISKLYEIELGDNLVGATIDQVICSRDLFKDYATYGVGVHYSKYFNSGMLLMNLKLMREENIEEQFINMFNKYHFDVVCPDQDYLNVLCYDRVLLLDIGWNKMSVDNNYSKKPNIIHYNMFNKPWQYDNIPYGEYFWEYAKKTDFYDEISAIKNSFSKEDELIQENGLNDLIKSVINIVNSDYNFKKIIFDKKGVEYER